MSDTLLIPYNFRSNIQKLAEVRAAAHRVAEIFARLDIDTETWAHGSPFVTKDAEGFNNLAIIYLMVLGLANRVMSFPSFKEETTRTIVIVSLKEESFALSSQQLSSCEQAYHEAITKAMEEAPGATQVLIPFSAIPEPNASVHYITIGRIALNDGLTVSITPEGINFSWNQLNPPVSMTFLNFFVRNHPELRAKG